MPRLIRDSTSRNSRTPIVGQHDMLQVALCDLNDKCGCIQIKYLFQCFPSVDTVPPEAEKDQHGSVAQYSMHEIKFK